MLVSMYARQSFFPKKRTKQAKHLFGNRFRSERRSSTTTRANRTDNRNHPIRPSSKSSQNTLPTDPTGFTNHQSQAMTPESIEYENGGMSQLSGVSFYSHGSHLGQETQSVASGSGSRHSQSSIPQFQRGGRVKHPPLRHSGQSVASKMSLTYHSMSNKSSFTGRVPTHQRSQSHSGHTENNRHNMLSQNTRGWGNDGFSISQASQSRHSLSVSQASHGSRTRHTGNYQSQYDSRTQYDTQNDKTLYDKSQYTQTQYSQTQGSGDTGHGSSRTHSWDVQSALLIAKQVEAAVLKELEPNVMSLKKHETSLQEQERAFYNRIQLAEDQHEKRVTELENFKQEALCEFQSVKDQLLKTVEIHSHDQDQKHQDRTKELKKLSSEITSKANQATQMYDSVKQLVESVELAAAKIKASVQSTAVSALKAVFPNVVHKKSKSTLKTVAVTPKPKQIDETEAQPTMRTRSKSSRSSSTTKKRKIADFESSSPFKPLNLQMSKKLRTPTTSTPTTSTVMSPKANSKKSTRRLFGSGKQSKTPLFEAYQDDDVFAFSQ